jgi:ABC-type transport system involved in cytochrome bd biosynthesis fused ATPase/permease subunit
LRRETAWLDPEVRLWNESLGENLAYGNTGAPSREAISAAALEEVMRRLPEGMDTRLGEGGGFLSAGEGQRVRIGRSLLREGVRLAVLDEPVRGLEHDRRTTILERLRERWRGATLLCITHDVADTRGFGRVLVIERGRIVEDGDPQALLEDSASRYRALFDAEEAARKGIWGSSVWRRLRMHGGKLEEAEERRAWAQR